MITGYKSGADAGFYRPARSVNRVEFLAMLLRNLNEAAIPYCHWKSNEHLRESLLGNRVTSILGIVNGTTNYILSRMTDEGLEYASVLKKAQELGFAEADPTRDLTGLDAADKIAVLAWLALSAGFTWSAGASWGELKLLVSRLVGRGA